MGKPVKAEAIRTKDYSTRQGRDTGLPDLVVEVEGIGTILLKHAEGIQCGFIPREDSDKQIALSVVSTSLGDEKYDGYGFLELMAPEEALMIGQSLIKLATEGPNMDGKKAH